jgi:hypothetical protein
VLRQFPAEAFILQNNNGAVVIEDRNNVAHAVPACFPSQISQVTSSSVNSGGSTFTASWTRPITLTPALIAEGFMNIPSGATSVASFCRNHSSSLPESLPASYVSVPGQTSIISAILYAVPPAYAKCSLSLIEHATAGTLNTTILTY